MSEKIYLGVNRDGEPISIEKHSWDCNWYWGFGYIGNKNMHYHIDSMINHPKVYCPNWNDVHYQFESTWLNQNQWWILRDLFISAYALKKAAEVYKHGGHQTSKANLYRVINPSMSDCINNDLKIILDNIWNLLLEWNNEYRQQQKTAALSSAML